MKPSQQKEYRSLLERSRERFRLKRCLHPMAPNDCKIPFVAAHTVQRAMIQKFLAEKGHVLTLKMDFAPNGSGPKVVLDRIGLNRATTFYGFCTKHDNDLFRPLEASEFTLDPRQIALLGFRAFSMELYKKEAELDFHQVLQDRVLQSSEEIEPERIQYLEGKWLGLANGQRNIKEAWKQFGEIVSSPSRSDLRYFAVSFDNAPVYFAASAFLPEWDFEGKEIQDLTQIEAFSGISFSSWAANGQSVVVFCWHQSRDHVCVPLIQSLRKINEARWGNRILAMAFEYSENVIFKPSWWEGLDESDKGRIKRRTGSGLLSQERIPESLREDGLSAFCGHVTKVTTNI